MAEDKAKFGGQVLERLLVDGGALIGMTLVSIIIARALGAEGKGAVALAMLIGNIVFIFSSFGIHQANNYFRGRRKEPAHVLYSNTIIFSIVVSIVASGIFIALYPIVADRFFAGLPVGFILLALTIIPFLHLQSSFTNFLLIEQKHRYFNAISFLKVLLNVILVYVFLYPLGLGIHAAVSAWVISQAFLAILTIYKTWTLRKEKFEPNISLMKQTFMFGLRGYVGNFIYFINQRLDVIMVSFFLPITEVGIYSVAAALSEILLQLPRSVTLLLFPRVAATTDESSNEFTPRIFRNILFLMIIFGAVLLLVGQFVIQYFFGSEFSGAVRPLYIMVPGVVLVGASTILGNDLSARGRLEIHSYIAAGGLIADVVLNVIFIPKFGLAGAALGSSLSYVLITLTLVISFKIITKVSFVALLVPQKSDFVYYLHLLDKLHLLPRRYQEKIS